MPTIPFLGATPDAAINAECIVEVKCPYEGKNEQIISGEHFKILSFERNGNVALKKNHAHILTKFKDRFFCQREMFATSLFTRLWIFVYKILKLIKIIVQLEMA